VDWLVPSDMHCWQARTVGCHKWSDIFWPARRLLASRHRLFGTRSFWICTHHTKCFWYLLVKQTNSKYHSVIYLSPPPPPTHSGYYKRDCGPKLFILFAYWPPPTAELCRPSVCRESYPLCENKSIRFYRRHAAFVTFKPCVTRHMYFGLVTYVGFISKQIKPFQSWRKMLSLGYNETFICLSATV
jgi:hypothetical protein